MTLLHDSTCPFCGKVNELSDGVTKAGVTKEPTPTNGDITLCVTCGEWSIVDDTRSDNLRKPSMQEYEIIAKNEVCQKVRDAWVQTKNAPKAEALSTPPTSHIDEAFEQMFEKVYGDRAIGAKGLREMRRIFYCAVYDTMQLLMKAHEEDESTVILGKMPSELIVELNYFRQQIIDKKA